MLADDFVSGIDNILKSNSAVYYLDSPEEGVSGQLINYLKCNLHKITKDELNSIMVSDKNNDILLCIQIVSKESINLLWKEMKKHNNDMSEAFKNIRFFHDSTIGLYNHNIIKEFIDLDVTNLLYQKSNKDFKLITNIVTSSDLSIIIDKKEEINKSSDDFKCEFLKSMCKVVGVISKQEEKEKFVQIILNTDNWQSLHPDCLRVILSLAALCDKQKDSSKILKMLALQFNKEFFISLKEKNIDLLERLLFTECVPTKYFIKQCAKYQKFNNNDWYNLIDFSSSLFNKKLNSSEKMSKIQEAIEPMSSDFFYEAVEFIQIRRYLNNKNNKAKDILDYIETQHEKKEIQESLTTQECSLLMPSKKRI